MLVYVQVHCTLFINTITFIYTTCHKRLQPLAIIVLLYHLPTSTYIKYNKIITPFQMSRQQHKCYHTYCTQKHYSHPFSRRHHRDYYHCIDYYFITISIILSYSDFNSSISTSLYTINSKTKIHFKMFQSILYIFENNTNSLVNLDKKMFCIRFSIGRR